MPSIPLGLQSYDRARGIQPETRLRNLYLEEDKSGGSPDSTYRLQRPGLTLLVTFPDPIRGIYQANNVVGGLTCVVAGDTLYTTDGATFDAVGVIGSDGDQVTMAASFERVGIASAGQFWTYDGTTLVQIDLPDDQSIADLTVLNSYFLLPLSDGKFFWLAPGSSTVDALDFASAEALPDGIIAARRLRDEVFFMGSKSIEVWQATGNADSLFQPAPGRITDRGVSARETVQLFDNSLVFLGDDNIVYRISDVPTRLSTFGIEERIRKATDLCSAFVFTSEGHKFYCLRVPGQGSFVYDAATQVWSEFSTLSATVWAPHCGLDTNNGAVCGDATGKFYRIDPDAVTDDGLAIERLVTGTVALANKPARNGSLALFVGCDDDATFSLRIKDAIDSDWSSPIALDAPAGSSIINAWRLGAGRGAYRTFEISTLSATKIRISGANANEAWAA
jgi:hypothetical protein